MKNLVRAKSSWLAMEGTWKSPAALFVACYVICGAWPPPRKTHTRRQDSIVWALRGESTSVGWPLKATGGTGPRRERRRRGRPGGGPGARQMKHTATGPSAPVRGRRRSFCLSFHLALLGPTGADRLDSPPDLSCKDSTRQYTVDDPRLSCKPVLCSTARAGGRRLSLPRHGR
jgi:hypothetical protein